MRRSEVLGILRQHQAELEQAGVKSLTLFGSMARDQARPDSDVDLLVEFDRPTGYFGLLRLQAQLSQLLGRRVELGTLNGLKPRVRETVLKEAIRVA